MLEWIGFSNVMQLLRKKSSAVTTRLRLKSSINVVRATQSPSELTKQLSSTTEMPLVGELNDNPPPECSLMNMISTRELVMQKKQLKVKELESLNEELQMVDNQIQLLLHSSSMRREAKCLKTDEDRNLRFQFRNSLPEEIETGTDIKSKEFTSIELELVDASGQLVTSGPAAFSTVEIVALRGDDVGPLVDLTTEEFNQRIISVWGSNKKPLLNGELQFKLNEGSGIVGSIKFRHSIDWMKQSKFMLGARDVSNFTGFPIKEAKTEPFKIKDRRNGYYSKRDTLTMEDEIYRLKNISYKGIYSRLKKERIFTMKDFLLWLFKEPAKLEILIGWPRKKFEETIKHAQKGIINEKLCCFSALDGNMNVVFDFVSQVLGVFSGGQYYHFDELAEEHKENAKKLAIHALQHWKDVCFVDSTTAKLHMIKSVLLSDDIDPLPENESIKIMVEEYRGELNQDSITNQRVTNEMFEALGCFHDL